MRGILRVAVLAGGLVVGPAAWAQVPGQTPQVPLPEPTLTPSLPPPTPAPEVEEIPDAVPAAPQAAPDAGIPPQEDEPQTEPPLAAAPEPAVPADPVVTSLRATLGDPAFRKDQSEADLGALAEHRRRSH